jgi:hypothetical protein
MELQSDRLMVFDDRSYLELHAAQRVSGAGNSNFDRFWFISVIRCAIVRIRDGSKLEFLRPDTPEYLPFPERDILAESAPE